MAEANGDPINTLIHISANQIPEGPEHVDENSHNGRLIHFINPLHWYFRNL